MFLPPLFNCFFSQSDFTPIVRLGWPYLTDLSLEMHSTFPINFGLFKTAQF